jgi:hypothetical protein
MDHRALALSLIIVVLLVVLIVASVGVIGFIRLGRDIGFRLPGFNSFTGRWSDEEERDTHHLHPEDRDGQIDNPSHD